LVEAQIRTLVDEIEENEIEISSSKRFHESYIKKIDSELEIIERESEEAFRKEADPIEKKTHTCNLETEMLKEEIRMLKLRFENMGKQLVEDIVQGEKGFRN